MPDTNEQIKQAVIDAELRLIGKAKELIEQTSTGASGGRTQPIFYDYLATQFALDPKPRANCAAEEQGAAAPESAAEEALGEVWEMAYSRIWSALSNTLRTLLMRKFESFGLADPPPSISTLGLGYTYYVGNNCIFTNQEVVWHVTRCTSVAPQGYGETTTTCQSWMDYYRYWDIPSLVSYIYGCLNSAGNRILFETYIAATKTPDISVQQVNNCLSGLIMRSFGDDNAAYYGVLSRQTPEFSPRYQRDYVGSGTEANDRALLTAKWSNIIETVSELFSDAVVNSIVDEISYVSEIPPPDYDFNIYKEDKINLGLQLVYRQEWRYIDTTPGEPIKTIPLEPKTVVKASKRDAFKFISTRVSEQTSQTEHTSSTDSTNKQSNDIVKEASKSFKWNAEVSAAGSYNSLAYKASINAKAGAGGDSKNMSKSTSSSLTEAVTKVASKVTTGTKITTSQEVTSENEDTLARDLTNPNSEICVNYLYRRAQVQFSVVTYLAKINDVLFIAEDVPYPIEIDLKWVKKHDTRISPVLLDESYRDALNSIHQEAPSPDLSGLTTELSENLQSSQSHLGSFAESNSQATDIDFIVEAQRLYRDIQQQKLSGAKAQYMLDQKRDRLYVHIRENILHYMRAIWANEDPQQRYAKYEKKGIAIPLQWELANRRGEIDVLETLDSLAQGGTEYWDLSVVDSPDSEMLPVTKLIVPGPAEGFFVNYSIYRVNPVYAEDSDLLLLLKLLKTPYLYPNDRDDEYGTHNRVTDPEVIDIYEKYIKDKSKETLKEEIDDYTRKEMIEVIPYLSKRYEKSSDQAGFLQKIENFIEYYAEYLYRKKATRILTINTNDALVDVKSGDGTIMEPLTRAERVTGVLDEFIGYTRERLENERREERIKAGNLEDPDSDKNITINGNCIRPGDVACPRLIDDDNDG